MKIINKIQSPVTMEFCEAVEKARCQLVLKGSDFDYVLRLETEAGNTVLEVKKSKAAAADLYVFKQLLETMCSTLSESTWAANNDFGAYGIVFQAPRLIVGTRTVREFYAEVDKMVLGIVVSAAASR